MSADLRSAVIDIGFSLNLRPAEASLIVLKSGRTGMSSRSVATLIPRASLPADRALIQISRRGASAFSESVQRRRLNSRGPGLFFAQSSNYGR
jgi:hypothetical protein